MEWSFVFYKVKKSKNKKQIKVNKTKNLKTKQDILSSGKKKNPKTK